MQVEVSFTLLATPSLWTSVPFPVPDVSRALAAKQPCFIKWPFTHDECAKIKNEFYTRGGFPGVVGYVDGTHVRLQPPTQNENNYVNRKRFYSINVQGVCNHEGE